MKDLFIFLIFIFIIFFSFPFFVNFIDYFTDLVVFASMNKSIDEFNQYRKNKFK